MEIERTFSGAKWQKRNGYCRAVRIGDRVFVSGTTSVDDQGEVHAPGDVDAQTRRCMEIIERALADLGAQRSDIVRTRIYLTDISQWREAGNVHHELFRDHPPANTLVEVSALIDPRLLVEVEAEAVVHSADQ